MFFIREHESSFHLRTEALITHLLVESPWQPRRSCRVRATFRSLSNSSSLVCKAETPWRPSSSRKCTRGMSARSAAWPELSLPVSKSFTAMAMRASRANSPSETCREARSDSGYEMLSVFMAGAYGTRNAEARWRLAPFICGESSGVAHGKMNDASADKFPADDTLTSQGGRCSNPSLPGTPASASAVTDLMHSWASQKVRQNFVTATQRRYNHWDRP